MNAPLPVTKRDGLDSRGLPAPDRRTSTSQGPVNGIFQKALQRRELPQLSLLDPLVLGRTPNGSCAPSHDEGVGWTAQQHVRRQEETMVLATAKIEDFDRFWNTFSTKGAEKRKQHGCKGAHVFRDPNESDRVWAIFDWDEAGWQSFTSDPEVPAIFQEAGFTQGPPKSAEFLRQHDA